MAGELARAPSGLAIHLGWAMNYFIITARGMGVLGLVALGFLLLTAGCATLPKTDNLAKDHPATAAPPKIMGAHRQLTPRESKALIQKIKRQAPPTDFLQRHIMVEEAIGAGPLVAGNKVTLLVDATPTYEAMTKAIKGAKDHINFETFIFDDDEVGRGFADLLLQKASQGVQVNLIYDSVGSIDTPATFFQRLRDGGVDVLEFNPVNPLEARDLQAITHRDHRKILVVDGSLAITGGVNISSAFSKFSPGVRDKDEGPALSWRDTDVKIEGQAVAEFQRQFLDTWQREKGAERVKGSYFPPLKRQGNALVRVIGSTTGENNRLTYLVYYSAIASADRSVHLTSSYFVPDEQILNALTEAARAGVDVKIILPSNSDSKVALYAGRSNYTQLLKAGVRIYEHRSPILHAKTVVIDGIWSSVGSTNMDMWSFLRNDEINAVILSQKFAGQMEGMFNRDLENSKVVDLETWEQRPLSERLKEVLARLASYWL
jgi:cardiolipin synthase